MGISKNIGRLFFPIALVLFFIDWKVALIVLGLGIVLFNLEMGPSFVLNALSGYISFCGTIFIFVNFKIGIILLVLGFFITVFRIKGDRVNHMHYGIMEAIVNKFNLQADTSNPWFFQKGYEGEYKIKFEGKKYDVKVKKSGKFSWDLMK